MKKGSRVFTPRPRSASRNTSCRTSRTASPTRSPKSPFNSQPSTPINLPKGMVTAVVDVDSLPQATTWDPDCGVRSIIVGIRDGGDGKDKGSASYEILDEGAAFERRHGSVFELPEGQAVVFQGVVDLCVLSGAVNVYEHTVTAGSGWSRIYSPSSHPLVSITAVRPSTGLDSNATSTGDGVERMRELWGSQAGSNADRAKRNLAVVALRSVVCGFEDIGAVVPPYRNLFAIKDFAERKAATQPSKAAKRRLAQRNASIAAKAMKTAAGSSIKDEAASVEDTEDDKAARDTGGYDSDDSDEEQAVSIDYAQIELGLKRAIGLPNFSPVSHMTPDLQLLQTPQDWRDTLDRVADAGLQLDDSFEPISPVCVIAGGVSQGKSTFTRLLINRLLRRFGRLFYMETDLGQSEFSPPGALTLSMVADPILGPPFTHASQIEPYHAVYMGVTTPKNDPDRYVMAIQRLSSVYRDYVSAYRMNNASATDDMQSLNTDELNKLVVPLVVNTHGWLKGLGLDMHYSLCEAVCPTAYIQLYDSYLNQSQNTDEMQQYSDESNSLVPIIDFSSIQGCDPQLNWISAMSYERAAQALHVRSIDAAAAAITDDMNDIGLPNGLAGELIGRKGPKLGAHDMRTLALISQLYLTHGSVHRQKWNPSLSVLDNPMWDMHAALVSRRPLVVPLSDIVLWFGDEDVPPSQVLRVLNGAVVGVIAISSAPGTNAHVWTGEEVRTLYQGGKGISDQAAVDLSEQGARTLLRTSVETYQNSHDTHHLANWHMPQIVYGHPSTEHTTLLTHAIVRSVDPTEGSVHLLLPPLVAGTSPAASSDALGSIDRIVGIVKGPGPGMHGIDLPVWPMIGDGFIERAMGSSSVRDLPRFARKGTKGKGRGQDGDAAGGDNDGDNDNALGIQEAPYLSVEADEGIGAATTRSRGGQMRRGLQ